MRKRPTSQQARVPVGSRPPVCEHGTHMPRPKENRLSDPFLTDWLQATCACVLGIYIQTNLDNWNDPSLQESHSGYRGLPRCAETFRGEKIVPGIETFRLKSAPDIEVRLCMHQLEEMYTMREIREACVLDLCHRRYCKAARCNNPEAQCRYGPRYGLEAAGLEEEITG